MALFIMQHCKGDTTAMYVLIMQSWKSVVFWMFSMQTRAWKRKIADNMHAFATGTMHFKAKNTESTKQNCTHNSFEIQYFVFANCTSMG